MPTPFQDKSRYTYGKGSHRRPEDTEKVRAGHERIFGVRSCLGCEDLEAVDGTLICVRCHEYVDNVKEPPCRVKKA